jgi:hypothetical protein
MEHFVGLRDLTTTKHGQSFCRGFCQGTAIIGVQGIEQLAIDEADDQGSLVIDLDFELAFAGTFASAPRPCVKGVAR